MPELSVVLIVNRRRERGARALGAILAQSAIARLEVLLFDFGHKVFPPLPGSEHPAVTTIVVQKPSSLGAVRLLAFQQSSSPWVAFTEEHVQVLPGWAEALLDRIEVGEWAGIGSEVRNLRSESRMGDAFYVLNFGRFSAPADEGPCAVLTGNNAAYRRDAVLALGVDLPDLLEMEPLLNWRLTKHGHILGIEPRARIVHANEPDLLAFVEANFVFSRLFGALRGNAQGWSRATRIVWAASAPVLPLIRLARLLRFVAARRPAALGAVLLSSPALLASQYSSVVGQSIGLLIGEGHSRHEFLTLDLDAPREEPRM
ncbi:MAG: hypothetical protein U0452_15785 [Anaerolineae bacterium]